MDIHTLANPPRVFIHEVSDERPLTEDTVGVPGLHAIRRSWGRGTLQKPAIVTYGNGEAALLISWRGRPYLYFFPSVNDPIVLQAIQAINAGDLGSLMGVLRRYPNYAMFPPELLPRWTNCNVGAASLIAGGSERGWGYVCQPPSPQRLQSLFDFDEALFERLGDAEVIITDGSNERELNAIFTSPPPSSNIYVLSSMTYSTALFILDQEHIYLFWKGCGEDEIRARRLESLPSVEECAFILQHGYSTMKTHRSAISNDGNNCLAVDIIGAALSTTWAEYSQVGDNAEVDEEELFAVPDETPRTTLSVVLPHVLSVTPFIPALYVSRASNSLRIPALALPKYSASNPPERIRRKGLLYVSGGGRARRATGRGRWYYLDESGRLSAAPVFVGKLTTDNWSGLAALSPFTESEAEDSANVNLKELLFPLLLDAGFFIPFEEMPEEEMFIVGVPADTEDPRVIVRRLAPSGYLVLLDGTQRRGRQIVAIEQIELGQ